MEKSTKKYWAILEGKEIKFEGTFSECWKEFVGVYGEQKVSWLAENNIRISRIS